jgi:hypothetical protein
VDDDVILMKHIVNNPEVIIKIDKEPEVEETKETEVNDDVLYEAYC